MSKIKSVRNRWIELKGKSKICEIELSYFADANDVNRTVYSIIYPWISFKKTNVMIYQYRIPRKFLKLFEIYAQDMFAKTFWNELTSRLVQQLHLLKFT